MIKRIEDEIREENRKFYLMTTLSVAVMVLGGFLLGLAV